ncbi:MAG: transposase [Elusimicrobiota bacterium]|nr:MAG: transposase [Elusimicrobiota bacterium]
MRTLNRMYTMGRRQRFHFAGAVYHAMARGVDKRDVFLDDRDRLDFLQRMRGLEVSVGAEVLAYCLMNNHFHLAIRVGAVALSSFMQRLEGHYSSWFNHRHKREGHLFQGRFKAFNCLDDRYFTRLIPYIHMNPVRAGLVEFPWEWRWSSFTGTEPIADDLSDFEPWPKEGTREIEVILRAEKGIVSLDSIADSIRAETGFDSSALKAHIFPRALIAARQRFVEESIRAGYSQCRIADWLGSTRSAISRFAIKVGKWEV